MPGEYVVSFEYPSAKTFVSLLRAVGEVADEILARFSPDGMRVRALDPARLSLIELEVPSSAFTAYEVRQRDFSVGMNLASLLKMLPKPKKSDVVRFSADETFYRVSIEGVMPKSFRFRSIEVPVEEIPELSFDFKARAVLPSRAFKEALATLGGSGAVEIEVSSADYVVLRGGGSAVKLSRAAGSVLDVELEESVRSAYEESYLSKAVPLLDLTDSLELSLSTSSPLSMVFRIPGDVLVRYILAPQA